MQNPPLKWVPINNPATRDAMHDGAKKRKQAGEEQVLPTAVYVITRKKHG